MTKNDIVFVDVDDTFVRSHGPKRIVIPHVVEYIRFLKESGAELYCWSSGGPEYARSSAVEFGIDDCFVGFLPKPTLIVDDQRVAEWRGLREMHPNECRTK